MERTPVKRRVRRRFLRMAVTVRSVLRRVFQKRKGQDTVKRGRSVTGGGRVSYNLTGKRVLNRKRTPNPKRSPYMKREPWNSKNKRRRP